MKIVFFHSIHRSPCFCCHTVTAGLSKFFLVSPDEIASDAQLTNRALPKDLEICFIKSSQLPLIIQNCCLPAVVENNGRFCRAGLAVVTRHIVHKASEVAPSKKDVLELLGFKKTCLKACAEVSEWTRLCELSIPLAVENVLKESPDQHQNIPAEVLQFERKLGEPVRVHNDDKIRRQKVQRQKTFDKAATQHVLPPEEQVAENLASSPADLELQVAFSKLTVQKMPVATNREPSHIRKMKTSELPPLEHVFAEGLYFTLTDIILFPCIHQFLVITMQNYCTDNCQPYLVFSKNRRDHILGLPLISRWYQRVQEVPGIKQAASKCGVQFFQYGDFFSFADGCLQNICTAYEEPEEKLEDTQFTGGPRPTMTKLMENGIQAIFSPHPCPGWALDWDSLPKAVNPGEGRYF
ncbi:hypothetical protein lerEdw1_012364, partial [Lerista edwardsae]